MRHLRPRRLLFALALVACLAGAAHAQVGASVSADSDYRYRGVSLSDGRPVFGASLADDSPSGLYGGATLLAELSAHAGLQPLGYRIYVGYSARLSSDSSWDAGVTNAGFTEVLDRRYSDDYTEVYVGVTRKSLSLHLYYTPDYLGAERGAVYVELNGAIRPAEHWRIFAQGGVLVDVGPRSAADTDSVRADVRAGVAREFKAFEVRLTATSTAPASFYPANHRQPRNQVVLGATVFF